MQVITAILQRHAQARANSLDGIAPVSLWLSFQAFIRLYLGLRVLVIVFWMQGKSKGHKKRKKIKGNESVMQDIQWNPPIFLSVGLII